MPTIRRGMSGKQEPFTIPEGSVEMEVDELRARFHVNSLLATDPPLPFILKRCAPNLAFPRAA